MTQRKHAGKECMDLVDFSYTDTESDAIEKSPIKITLAGHTCAGKTEWLISLLCEKVGEVSPRPDITSKITPVKTCLPESDDPYILIYDVPGQQFSGEVLHRVKKTFGPYPTKAEVLSFIDEWKYDDKHEHADDICLLDHFRSCDVVLYLADCKAAPSVADLDEFNLVRRLGNPVIGILNFTGGQRRDRKTHLEIWHEKLKNEGAKAVIELDAFNVCPRAVAELGKELSRWLPEVPPKRKFMKIYWHEKIEMPAHRRRANAVSKLAEFLVNVATYCERKRLSHTEKESDVSQKLENIARETVLMHLDPFNIAIQQCFKFQKPLVFKDNSVFTNDPKARRKNDRGLFGGRLYERVTRSVGRGAAIGGVIGGTLAGVFSGGMGAPEGFVAGAAFGAIFDTGLSFQVRKTRYRNLGVVVSVQITERTLALMCKDGLTLIDALLRRGYGCTDLLDVRAASERVPSCEPVLCELRGIRNRVQWSRWVHPKVSSGRRTKILDRVRDNLYELLEQCDHPGASQTRPASVKKLATESTTKMINRLHCQLRGVASRARSIVRAK